jgi:hypothetical protein
VVIETGTPDEPEPPANPDAFVDECANLDDLTDGADMDILGVDTNTPKYFDRPNGGSNGARITRNGTTETARLEYDLGTELEAVRVESHRNFRTGGDVTFLESTDGGDSYTTVDTEDSEFGTVGSGNWNAVAHKANLSEGADRFAIELANGKKPWSPQIGRVIIEPAEEGDNGDENPDRPRDPDDPEEPGNPDDPADGLHLELRARPQAVEPGDRVVLGVADFETAGTPIDTIEWDFDDGTSDTGWFVSHRFDETGTYTVECTASDSFGRTTSETIEVNVSKDGIIDRLLGIF